jgi:hypothetical protein
MPGPGRPMSAGHPTRHQLDELDALMERMLALPVNQPEEIAAPRSLQTARVSGDEIRPAPGGPVLVAREDTIIVTPGSSSPRGMDEFVRQSIAQAPDIPPTAKLTAPQPNGPSMDGAIPRRAEPEHSISPILDSEATATLIAPLWLRILMWSNRRFDSGTVWLGPAGRWLRSRGGRMTVGVTGILLLAGAASWLVLGAWGWTW